MIDSNKIEAVIDSGASTERTVKGVVSDGVLHLGIGDVLGPAAERGVREAVALATDDPIRGLQETIVAQAQRLGEFSRLHDLAHAAKQYVIGEHAAEREKRQALEVAIGQAQTVIVDLVSMLDRGPSNLAEAHAMFEQANAWLSKHGRPA